MSKAKPAQEDQNPEGHEPQPVGPPPEPAAGDDAPPASANVDELATDVVADLVRWRQEAERANDRALRSQAELENFRKRARREMEEERRYAALPLLADLLEVVDNLDRAMAAANGSDQIDGLREGVKMVAAQLTGVLAKHHCHPVEALGRAFDPHLHEALLQVNHDEYPAGTVSHVARPGYRLHDRIVRPAQVLVSQGPSPTAENGSAEGDDGDQSAST
jgi:molecular chaperone GrpE